MRAHVEKIRITVGANPAFGMVNGAQRATRLALSRIVRVDVAAPSAFPWRIRHVTKWTVSCTLSAPRAAPRHRRRALKFVLELARQTRHNVGVFDASRPDQQSFEQRALIHGQRVYSDSSLAKHSFEGVPGFPELYVVLDTHRGTEWRNRAFFLFVPTMRAPWAP